MKYETMEQCTAFIFSLKASQYKGKPLEAVTKLLAALGNPERNVRYIHFAGSNGKGSTLNATREILMQHGVTVGAFISPHLERANERITINKIQISDAQFLYWMNVLHEAIERELDGKYPSFFEVMTLLAFIYFNEIKPDVVLLETGIGGRIDTTNVIVPELSVITTISLEHTDLLGDTYAQVAAEKAGIIKDDKPVVVGVKQQEALAVIRETASDKNAPYYELGRNLAVTYEDGAFSYEGLGARWQHIQLAMQGTHQMDNASLAITAARLFDPTIAEQTIRRALGQASWSGRFERIDEQIILDGAHNSEGTRALIATLKRVYPFKRYHFVYAVMKDKDHAESIALMDAVAASMTFTQIAMPRAAEAHTLASQSKAKEKFVEANWQRAIDAKLGELTKDDILIVTGSLYFISETRPYVLKVVTR